MKKALCLVLSLIMMFSVCFTAPVYAEDETGSTGEDAGFDIGGKIDEYLGGFTLDNYTIPEDFYDAEIEQLLEAGYLAGVDIGGISLEYLYTSKDPMPWQTMTIDKNSVYLAMGNLNMYLQNLMFDYFKDDDVFTSETATWLANWIVDIFFGPECADVKVTLSEEGDLDTFVVEVLNACRGPFGVSLYTHLENVWLESHVNFWPIIYSLGTNLDDIYVKTDITEILEETLRALILNFRLDPLYSIIDILWAFSRHYNSAMVVPIDAALDIRVSNNHITAEEICDPHNVLNLIFNGNNSANTGKLQFMSIPYQRFAVANDRVDCFYTMIVYVLLISGYKNNSAVFGGYKNMIQANENLPQADKDNLCNLIDSFTKGDFNYLMDFTVNGLIDNATEKAKNIVWRIIERIREILEDFVLFLDNIFTFGDRWQ